MIHGIPVFHLIGAFVAGVLFISSLASALLWYFVKETLDRMNTAFKTINDFGSILVEHTWKITDIKTTQDRARIVQEAEHERLSRHIVEITGDHELLRERVIILEIHMERRGNKREEKAP